MLRTIYTQLLFETRLTYEFNQTGAPSEKENYGETPPGDWELILNRKQHAFNYCTLAK